jgi:NADH-quinone oxidoreductase subunit E
MAVRRLAAPDLQPASFAFTAANLAFVKTQIANYPEGRQASAVIALLWRAQQQAGGWLPEAAIRYVADLLGMAHIRVLEVATFYTMFNLEPVGRYHVQVCGTTPCRLRGAQELLELCREKIGPPQRVSANRLFSWIEVECLAACVNAPVAQINEDTYEDLTPELLAGIIDQLTVGATPKPGPQIDRQFSAPIGGPTTLTDPGVFAARDAGGPGRQSRGPALRDANPKRPGEPANIQESPVPKAPARDGSQPGDR